MSGWRVTGHSDATSSVVNTTRVQPAGAGNVSTCSTGPRVGWPRRVRSSVGASLIDARLCPTPVGAAAGAGLAHLDGGQPREAGGDPVPDPDGEHLAGRVLQPLDVVEEAVVQRV